MEATTLNNEMEQKMEDEMEAMAILGLIWGF